MESLEAFMRTILLIIDHGLSLAYFLYTDLAKKMLEQGVRLVFLVQDEVLPKLCQDFKDVPNLVFESVREQELVKYQWGYHGRIQNLLEFVRGSVASPRIPLTYVDTHRQRKLRDTHSRIRAVMLLLQPVIYLLRVSALGRRLFMWLQNKLFTSDIYADIFEKYRPDLVLSGTAGWRNDRYLLREANRRGLKTGMFVIGWDNPSCNGLPGAHVQYANVWSQIHIWELNAGLDWPKKDIHIGGMPLYDNYLSGKWLIPRAEYFKLHGLDPKKKLVVYVATALSITPNLHIVKEMIDLVTGGQLSVPAQLMIRLHPNHFKPVKHYQEEREAIYALAKDHPEVVIVAPRALAGDLPRYSGEDFEEKASMLAHCDVMVSIYSTMVVEASLHDKPVVSACINHPTGWPNTFWVPLDTVPSWPTAKRVMACNASQVAYTPQELRQALDAYLIDPALHAEGRRKFVEQELTFLKAGQATQQTADYLLSLVRA